MNNTGMKLVIGSLLITVPVSACSNAGEGQMADNFHCATMIAAYMKLTMDGAIGHDRELFPRSVTAQMDHLNRWAMPQGLSERDAFAQVNTERDRIIAEETADEIAAAAKNCIAQVQ